MYNPLLIMVTESTVFDGDEEIPVEDYDFGEDSMMEDLMEIINED